MSTISDYSAKGGYEPTKNLGLSACCAWREMTASITLSPDLIAALAADVLSYRSVPAYKFAQLLQAMLDEFYGASKPAPGHITLSMSDGTELVYKPETVSEEGAA